MKIKSYQEVRTERMRDPNYARGLVMHALECGDSVEEALTIAITCMGVENFSAVSGIRKQHVSAFVAGARSFGHETLAKCLSVFGLKFSATEDKSDSIPTTFFVPHQKQK